MKVKSECWPRLFIVKGSRLIYLPTPIADDNIMLNTIDTLQAEDLHQARVNQLTSQAVLISFNKFLYFY